MAGVSNSGQFLQFSQSYPIMCLISTNGAPCFCRIKDKVLRRFSMSAIKQMKNNTL